MTVYHPGELAAQARAGVVDDAARLAGMFRSEVPPPAAAFLAEQPMLVLGGAGSTGSVWATMLTGRPGFLSVDGGSTLVVDARPGPDDPLADALSAPAQVGMIAIQPGTRRRVRMNGLARPDGDGLRVELAQVYANCPKYIQKREPYVDGRTATTTTESTALEQEDLASVAGADTFFVATVGPDGAADASHRGGSPGFLRATGPTTLQWPDYVGNAMFNTFGNLEVDPRIGLLVPDWATGDLLHLTGTAVVDWDPTHAAAFPGAERLVDLTVERVVRVGGASPLRWTAPEPSRFNPPAR